MMSLILALVVLGALLYIISLLPIDGTVKQIIYVVAIIAAVIWLFQFMGWAGSIRNMPVQ